MPSFNPKTDVPDLTGKVIIVTGSNVGIGYETVKALLEHNATVYMACRSESKANAAIAQLAKDTGRTAIFHELDLNDLVSVRRSAEEFSKREQRLDRLYNNAGVLTTPLEDLTAQGYDKQFGINVVGHYFFTKLLWPLLQKAKVETGDPGRVIFLSSDLQKLASGNGLDLSLAVGGPARDKYIKTANSTKSPWTLYGLSKMGGILVSNHLARDFPTSGVVSVSVHPGLIVGTDLQRTTPAWQTFILKWFSGTNEQGAYASLYAGVAAEPEKVNGQYVVPWGKIGKSDKRATNKAIQDELVNWLDKELARY